VFDCSDTQNLRSLLGIETEVLYTEDQPITEGNRDTNSNEEEELLQLEPRELVKTVATQSRVGQKEVLTELPL